MRTVVLGPAAELSFRRYLDELPGFEEAYGALTAALAAKPRRGISTVGGGWKYALAERGRPSVRATYTFDDREVTIHRLDSSR